MKLLSEHPMLIGRLLERAEQSEAARKKRREILHAVKWRAYGFLTGISVAMFGFGVLKAASWFFHILTR